jgi:hypothetical protein
VLDDRRLEGLLGKLWYLELDFAGLAGWRSCARHARCGNAAPRDLALLGVNITRASVTGWYLLA